MCWERVLCGHDSKITLPETNLLQFNVMYNFKMNKNIFEGTFLWCACCVLWYRTTIEWAKARNFPPYSQSKMEDTRFADLTVKVGFPYLYCHQGDCEHLVIITDVRLVLCLFFSLVLDKWSVSWSSNFLIISLSCMICWETLGHGINVDATWHTTPTQTQWQTKNTTF